MLHGDLLLSHPWTEYRNSTHYLHLINLFGAIMKQQIFFNLEREISFNDTVLLSICSQFQNYQRIDKTSKIILKALIAFTSIILIQFN